ncbi:MAG: GIY-YIG nuclease family protein [Bacteroidetes bacterium]|nr:GIY-YIG nuclease family protein [Bacteroidota bacterium]
MMKLGQFYIYILTNRSNHVLYTGVTNNLKRRILEHKKKKNSGFTSQYNVDKLVYYEVFDSIKDAIYREKQIKAGPRRKKIGLIEGKNKTWRDLFEDM